LSTDNGIPANVVPNKTQVDLAQQKAEHDMIIQSTPGTAGAGTGGTVNEIFDAIVADAMAQGVKDQLVTGNTAAAEGAPNARQAPAQQPVNTNPGALAGDEVEKAAAVSVLVENGVDFDNAVALVKRAEAELKADEDQQVKQAAFNELIAQGVSFSDAVAMIKSASAGTDDVELLKKEAFDKLVASGVDFESAIAAVEAKAQELFGN
jgi:hypothetical protein